MKDVCGATIAPGSVTCEKEPGHGKKTGLDAHHMAGVTTFWNFDGRESGEKDAA